MAEEFDTVSVDQLDDITLALNQYFSIANVYGKLFKSTLGDVLTFITPFIPAISGSGLVFPDANNVLPNPTTTIKGSIVGQGTFTWSGGSLQTTSLLNIIATNQAGTAWVIVKAVDALDSVLALKSYIDLLKSMLSIDSTADTSLSLMDANGNQVLYVDGKTGGTFLTDLNALTVKSLEKIDSPLMITDRIKIGQNLYIEYTPDFEYIEVDANDNINVGRYNDGTEINENGNNDPNETLITVQYPYPPIQADVVGVDSYGQSLSTGADSSPALSTVAQSHVTTFNPGPRLDSFTEPFYLNFKPLVESAVETPCYGIGTSIKQSYENETGFVINDTNNLLDLVVSNPGHVGTQILGLSKGTEYYNRWLAGVVAGKTLSAAQGKTYKYLGFTWMQGESDYGDTTDVDYINLMLKLYDDMNADAKIATGQSDDIVMVCYQSANEGAYVKYPYIPLAMLKVCTDLSVKGKRRIYMSGAMNYTKNHVAAGIHLTNDGSKRTGIELGYGVMRSALEGKDVFPLYPTSFTRSNTTVQIDYKIPVAPLVFDNSIVTDPGSYGFRLYNADRVAKTISSISIQRGNSVKITCSETIQAGWILEYGILGLTGSTSSGPITGNRGCLRDSQGTTVVYNVAGFTHKLDNYSARFSTILK